MTDEMSASKYIHLSDSIEDILSGIGEDPRREGLKETPARVMRSWAELYRGYSMDPEKVLSTQFKAETRSSGMVACIDIEFYSTCEHHMLPFFGTASVAYLPSKKIVGLSKLARIVECFSRRLQNQERLTDQIADSLMKHLSPLGAGVRLQGKHFCMMARGVSKQNSSMVTQSFRGSFKTDPEIRSQFFSLIGGK